MNEKYRIFSTLREGNTKNRRNERDRDQSETNHDHFITIRRPSKMRAVIWNPEEGFDDGCVVNEFRRDMTKGEKRG